MSAQSFTIRPSGGGVGAFVEGIDLTGEISTETSEGLKRSLGEHGVLFFRGQPLSPEQHIAFAEGFAKININRFFTPVEGFPAIAEVRKEPDHTRNIGGGWHTDHTYDEEPAMGSILLAKEVPQSGGDTMFANMYSAYDTLSDGLKETLGTMRAVHSSRQAFGAEARYRNETNGRLLNAEAATQDSVHPVCITHPISGRKALYVNRAFTVRFDGWTEEESQPLLNMLYAHGAKMEHTFRFSWEEGSMAFWDNRASWHYALNDYPGQRRLMHRITVEGVSLSA
jgi:taurine dioxygenase